MRAEGQLEEEEEEEEEEIEIVVEEYIVYICECCDKKFRTRNHFVNHTNSRRHRAFAAIFEDAGMTPIGVEIRGAAEEEEEEEDYEDEVFDDDDDSAEQEEVDKEGGDILVVLAREEEDSDSDSDSDSEPEQDSDRKPNLFSAFAAAFDDDESSGSSSSSSSSSSESSEDEEEEDAAQEGRIDAKRPLGNDAADGEDEDEEEEADLLEEIIYQNQILQGRIDAEEAALVAVPPPAARAPLPFDDERYDPDDYGVNENRLAAVHHRLQKR